MAKKIQRQIRYEFRSESDPIVHHMNFVIINETRQSDKIEQKVQEIFAPVDEVRIRTSGAVKGTKIKYTLFSFDSYTPNPLRTNLLNVYRGKITRDPNLTERQSPEGLTNYVDSYFSNPENLS
ncbi:hypothetical protein J4402_00440 [Candidatus Pacearchaeota archaeon]|nr:hypothetical protein [Candidatus Pacearchaeota archaeon]